MIIQEEATKTFDIFISHNSKDKLISKELSDALSNRGIRVWLDEDQLFVGEIWQDKIEQAIPLTRAIAVLIGKNGLGQWQEMEMRIGISESVTSKIKLFAILLADAPEHSELPKLLNQFTSLDMRDGVNNVILEKIEMGIFGKKYKVSIKNSECYVLLAKNDEFPARICEELSNWLKAGYIDLPDPENEIDYQRQVKKFLDCTDAKWLVTIAHANQVKFYEREVFPRLKENPIKKIIFFESGRELNKAWSIVYPDIRSPIIVLETEHEEAAKSLLSNLNDYLPLDIKRISVVMLIPAQYPGNLRSKVYQKHFGNRVSDDSFLETQRLHPNEIEIFKWYLEKWPEKEDEIESFIFQRETSILAAMDAEAAIFLCGNDKIARGVRTALEKIKSNNNTHAKLKAKPILVGFDNSPKNKFYFQNSGYTLLTADIKLQLWCEDIAKLIYGERNIPHNNAFPSTAIVMLFQ